MEDPVTAEMNDTDNEMPQNIDTKCVAVSTCVANSGDHRKVVSHIFGRNKACTRELPNNLWIFWCRKHYQRFKYRNEDDEKWHTVQLGLVRQQLDTFEDWGEVRSWTIALRKAEQDALIKENKNGVAYTNHVSSCWERFLIPYLGTNKTFVQVRRVLEVIQREFNEPEFLNRDKKLKTFPGVEFLPNIRKATEVKKPATKKGEITYKKITLDQPAFNRKTRANTEYLRELVAKKGEASNASKSPSTMSEKDKSPESVERSDTSATLKHETAIPNTAVNDPTNSKSVVTTAVTPSSSKALPTKRKSMTLAHKAALDDQHNETPAKRNETPTKRRRLTRGFEKHGSDGDETTLTDTKEGNDEY